MGEAQVRRTVDADSLTEDGAVRPLSAVSVPPVAAEPADAPSADGEFIDFLEACRELREFEVAYDSSRKILWTYFSPKDRPSITRGLAAEGRWIQEHVTRHFTRLPAERSPAVRYMVCGSTIPGVYSMGGDLRLFEELVGSRDRASLTDYAVACIDLVYANYVNLDLPVITISMVQGDALGGGFEAALSGNLVIAERGTKFGLPECLFNLFPGMGAYSLISRRLGPIQAERMILSGRIYSAEELFELGLVDHLAEAGEAPEAVRAFVDGHDRQHRMRRSIYQARRRVNPVTYDELRDIAMVWVDTVLEMSPADLRKMARMAAAQDRRRAPEARSNKVLKTS